MRVAIMQPYLFPYPGYYQLMKAADVFFIYDDVNYIKKGWINRNRIILNGKEFYFTLPCKKISQNKLINEIEIDFSSGFFTKFLKTVEQGYKRAPYFNETMGILSEIMLFKENNLALFLKNSILKMAEYLNLDRTFELTSIANSESRGMEKADRLIAICSKIGAKEYINSMGGVELYKKEYFKDKGIKLLFLKSGITEYSQYSDEFIGNLSIIDFLMYEGKESAADVLDNYELI